MRVWPGWREQAYRNYERFERFAVRRIRELTLIKISPELAARVKGTGSTVEQWLDSLKARAVPRRRHGGAP